MKLDYKILWLDDKMDEILADDYPNEIYDHLNNLGFKPSIVTSKNEKEFFDKLNDSYDLILTDFHLDETTVNTRNGDAIITEVRNRSIYTEIMFYSAQGDVADTIKKDRITFFDTRKATGNVHYEKIVEKAITLIDLTVKKFQHIVAMRGMIMNETSSLDVEFTDILENLILNNDQAIAKIKERYKKFNSDNSNEVDNLTLKDLLYKIGASHRWKGLKENIAKDEIYSILLDYEKEIIITRNKFAHAVLERDENGRDYFKDKKDGIDFNEERCREIRINISKHKKNILELKKKIIT